MRNLRDIFNLEESYAPSIHLDMALESAIDGNKNSMNYHLIELLYDELSQIPNSNNINYAFRFTKIPSIKGKTIEENPVVLDILNNSLTLSNPCAFNDPMDPILRQWMTMQQKECKDKSEKENYKMLDCILKDNLRMSCLVTPKSKRHRQDEISIQDCSLLMWAHYADMHKGLCIQYEINDDVIHKHNNSSHLLKWGDVRYRDRKPICSDITLDNALLAKADCWDYEEESRLIYYNKNRKMSDYVPLAGFPVKAVYLGCRFSPQRISVLKKLLETKNIPLYIMKFCKEDITKIREHRIL